MERKAIATVRLAPGRAGFYDPLSRVHLTVGRPKATIYSGTNCASLRRNVKAGVIRLEEGTLGEDVPPLKLVPKGDGTYRVMSNAAEEMKPVFAENDSIPVKNVEEKTEELKEEPKVEEIKADELEKEEARAEEEKAEEASAEETESEDASEEESEEKPSDDAEESDDSADAQPEKKRRGRPRKNAAK